MTCIGVSSMVYHRLSIANPLLRKGPKTSIEGEIIHVVISSTRVLVNLTTLGSGVNGAVAQAKSQV